MKRLFTTVLLLSSILVFGQFGEQHFISNQAGGSRIYSFDLDNDQDQDLLTLKSGSGNFIWFENQDGEGNFSEEKNINLNDVEFFTQLDYEDVDNDGDNDILYVLNNSDVVKWIENLGDGEFDIERTLISNHEGSLSQIYYADMDGDNHTDVIKVFIVDGGYSKLVWYKNLTGMDDLGPEQVLTEQVFDIGKPIAQDINNDGLIDLVFGFNELPFHSAQIAMHRNLGNGDFEFVSIFDDYRNSDYAMVTNIKFDDINGDGLDDMRTTIFRELSGYYFYINFAENFIGEFGPKISLPSFGFWADADSDGDLDLVQSKNEPFRIVWLENLNGLADLGSERIVDTDLEASFRILPSYIDSDDKVDLFAIAPSNPILVWYQNTDNLGVDDSKLNNITLYPNPTTGSLSISGVTLENVSVQNTLGQTFKVPFTRNAIDISNLAIGVYYLNVITEDGNTYNEQIIKK